MSQTTRFAALALLPVVMIGAPSPARAGGLRNLLRLADRGHAAPHVAGGQYVAYAAPSYSYAAPPAYRAASEYRLAAYESAPMPAEATASEPAAYGSGGGDPYGFAALLNQYRASAGLPPVGVDANLSAWASQNNAACTRRGLGHHVTPNCVQNCGWNYASAAGVMQGWLASPGHRANLLNPSISRIGIAYGPGPYWTMNAL